MGGKGKRRREKNYLAAHGGPARLPPPPDLSKLDALPSKLRKLMSFTSYPHDSAKEAEEKKENNKKARVDSEKRVKPGSQIRLEAIADEGKNAKGLAVFPVRENGGDKLLPKGEDEKRKKKRKRNQVKDLRFEKEMEDLEGRSRRQERKKKYWEAKKKKNKKTEESFEDFPKHEKIRFGDVVEAPPKLAVVPKARKSLLSASKERLRLEAIEAYRTRKGWTSRPGLQFPSMPVEPKGK